MFWKAFLSGLRREDRDSYRATKAEARWQCYTISVAFTFKSTLLPASASPLLSFIRLIVGWGLRVGGRGGRRLQRRGALQPDQEAVWRQHPGDHSRVRFIRLNSTHWPLFTALECKYKESRCIVAPTCSSYSKFVFVPKTVNRKSPPFSG